jgi:putative ABC transport system permease protein
MISDYFSLAFGNLRHRGLRSWLTILGVFIGIAALVALVSLGDALQSSVNAQFGTLSPDKLIVQSASTGFGPPGSTAVKKLTSHDLKIIESVSGVDIAIPRLIRIAKVEYNKNLKFKYLASIPEDKIGTDIVYSSANLKVGEGRLLESSDRGKIVVGSDFVTNDEFGKKIRIGSKLLIQGKEFDVVGILEKSSSIINNGAIIMPEKDVKEALNISDEIDMIVVQVKDKNQAEQISQEIARKMRSDRNEKPGEEDFTVQTPLQSIKTVNTILSVINYIIIGIAAISLIVGAIGITNTMYTSVIERTREIGIMKAIGAQNRDILFIFLIESGLLGLVGGIVGMILGLGMAMGVSQIAGSFLGGIDFKIAISFPLVIFSVLFAFGLGMLAGVLPALQASKLKPVEALRK